LYKSNFDLEKSMSRIYEIKYFKYKKLSRNYYDCLWRDFVLYEKKWMWNKYMYLPWCSTYWFFFSHSFILLCSYLILSVLPYFIIVFMWLKVQPLSYMTRNKYYGCRVSKYESKGKEKIEKKEVSNDILNSNIINCWWHSYTLVCWEN